jgi:hypothetical protein
VRLGVEHRLHPSGQLDVDLPGRRREVRQTKDDMLRHAYRMVGKELGDLRKDLRELEDIFVGMLRRAGVDDPERKAMTVLALTRGRPSRSCTATARRTRWSRRSTPDRLS